jgi:hypothetical protein
MLRKVAIGKLRPNPFRRLDEYPILPEKIEALKSSIENTGFWRTIVGRPAADGCVEVAFGHHRLLALLELFGVDESVEILVQDISDEDMVRMMANENMAEWGASGSVEVETIRATIEAASRGRITLPEVDSHAPKPRRLSNDSLTVRYTMASIATFLGWTDRTSHGTLQPNFRCKVAFAAVDAIDEGLVKPADLRGLSRYKIHELILGARKIRKAEKEAANQNAENARRAQALAAEAAATAERRRLERQAEVYREQAEQHETMAETKAKAFVGHAVSRFRKRGGLEEVREMAHAMASVVPREKEIPDVNGVADRLSDKLANILDGDDGLSAQLAIVKEFRRDLSKESARRLAQEATLLRLRLQKGILTMCEVD